MKRRFTRETSIIGLAFEGGLITALEIRGTHDRCKVIRSMREPLSQNLLSGNPELVGAEIRKHLEDAEIRNKSCVVCLPLSWTYFLHIELPGVLSGPDRESYIRLQAERGFPFNPEDMILSISVMQTPEGKEHATVAAVPIQHITILQKALKAARLRPLSLTLGLACLMSLDHTHQDITLSAYSDGIDMGIARNGAPIFIRSLSDAVDTGDGGASIDRETLIRELRVTLGRLPADIRSGIHSLSFYGDFVPEDIFKDQMINPLVRLGIQARRGDIRFNDLDVTSTVSPYACAAGINHLTGKPPWFEFLQPASDRIKKIMGRVSARGFVWLAAAAAGIVFLIVCAFLIQYRYLASLEKKWNLMKPVVTDVEEIQEKLKKYRPWHDDSIQSLSLLRDMTSAFPERGDVWVRTLDIRDMAVVQCTGEARNNKVWMEMLSRLRQNSSVDELKVLQVREGDGLLQFTIRFQWKGASSGI